MTLTLLAKELRQHGWALLLLAALNLVGLALILFAVWDNPFFGTRLTALQGHLWLLALFAVILGNRLVVAEYHAQTQLFLEALPVPRWRVFMVKYCLGLAVVVVMAISAFGAIILAARPKEDMTVSFVQLLLTRYLLFAWMSYGFFFMAGFLGKFRWGYFGFILIAIIALNSLSDYEVFRSGPFKLVTGDFLFEHNLWPVDDLLLTAALIGGLFLVSLLLACLQEGSIAGKLGERLSFREKITVFVLLIGSMATVQLIDSKQPKQAYDTHEASAASNAAITVKVSPQSADGDLLAQRLADDFGAMAEFLDIEKLPPLFITERPDLDADRFEYGILPNAEGVALRTHFSANDWRYVDFLEFAIGGIMYNHSNGRDGHEPAFWIIDGFCLYWAHRRAGDGQSDSASAEPIVNPIDPEGPRRGLWLRALYGCEGYAEPLTRDQHLLRWFVWQQRSGHHITAGVGWSGLVTLREQVGEEKFRDFLRSTLGKSTPVNVTTTVRDLLNPPERCLEQSTGLDYPAFLRLWNEQLGHARDLLDAELRAIPRLEGRFEFVAQSKARRSFTGEYQFEAPGESGELSRAVLLYGEPFDFYTQVAESDLKRYPLSLEAGLQEGAVYQDFSAGARVSHTFSAHHRTLGCPIISGWQLTEVR